MEDWELEIRRQIFSDYLMDKKAEADQELSDAEQKINDAKNELDNSENKLNKSEKELNQKEKDVAKKGDKATKAEKDELDKMKAERKTKFDAMQQNLDQLQYNLYDKISSDINVAITETAKTKKLDVAFCIDAIIVNDEEIHFLENITL